MWKDNMYKPYYFLQQCKYSSCVRQIKVSIILALQEFKLLSEFLRALPSGNEIERYQTTTARSYLKYHKDNRHSLHAWITFLGVSNLIRLIHSWKRTLCVVNLWMNHLIYLKMQYVHDYNLQYVHDYILLHQYIAIQN